MTSKTNEKGLMNIFSGLGINNEASILELIDNSIDAKAKNIDIIISKEGVTIPIKGKNITIDPPLLIIKDDGIGMGLDDNNSRFEKLMNIMTKNTSKNVNGLFGLGAISSNHQICKKRDDPKTIIISKTKENDLALETIIDWNIFNKEGWSNKFQVVSSSSNLFNKEHGTLIINTIDTDYNQLVEKLKYKILFHYYYHLNNSNIVIKYQDQLKNQNWSLSKDESICNFDGSKNKLNKVFTFDIHYNENVIYFKPLDYKNLSINTGLLKVFPLNNNSYPRDFSDKIYNKIEESDLHFDKLKLTIVIVNPQEIKEIDNFYNQLELAHNTTDYTGLYIKRNNKILSKPFSTEYVRNSQTGNNFRYILEYSNNTTAVDVRINKSEMNESSINKLLFRGISILVKKFYNSYVKDAKFNLDNFNNKNNVIDLESRKKSKKKSKCKSKKKSKKKVEKLTLTDSDSDSSSSDSGSSTTEKKKSKKRRGFSEDTKNIVKQQSNYRCAITDVKLETGVIDFDLDHIDNDSSNNDLNNCQILSLQAHRNKTNKRIDDFSDKNITENLLKQLNCILESKYIKSKLEERSIKFKSFSNQFELNQEIFSNI